VASTDIAKDTLLTRRMVTTKSPGMGLSPQLIDQLIGRKSVRAIKRDECFTDDDLGLTEVRHGIKPVDVGMPWGIIARFTDLHTLLPRFEKAGMSFVEFHVSDRDLDAGIGDFTPQRLPFDLVVHAPEYCHDKLIDFCAADKEQREMSVQRIQKVIDLVRQLEPSFAGRFERGPKIVFHVGGMSPTPGAYDRSAACERLLEGVKKLDRSGVDLLLENLPPFPWYFGGRWFGHILTDGANTEAMCRESGMGLCFDTSHAGLQCHRTGEKLADFARRVMPFVRHLHISDAMGTSGEGMQIGEGQINFVELVPILLQGKATMVPEIWMGHHQEGKGFQVALERLTDILWASRVLGRGQAQAARPELEQLVVASSANLLTALQTIDANLAGIAFVIDEHRVVLGVITDGDIRHGLVHGHTLQSPVVDVMTRQFRCGTTEMTPEQMYAILPGRTRVMPIVDKDGKLVDFATGLTVAPKKQ
jgi:N-acetylneuraminate synthase